MVATLEPRNEASGDVFELGAAESTLGELTLMYSHSSDGEKPKPRIVQVIGYGESASQPLLHADDHVPSSSSCHSTMRLSSDGSAFAPHDSAGTGTGDGDSTVLNGGDGVAEQSSTSCNNIRKASVLGSDGSACVRHESAGTGDGDPTVLNCVRHDTGDTATWRSAENSSMALAAGTTALFNISHATSLPSAAVMADGGGASGTVHNTAGRSRACSGQLVAATGGAGACAEELWRLGN
ncbi:hypothetical protein JKP88DRAFT_277668 [Tribonema minus]|uniref:Uncharacterized protein n=1 Tax=Tribonema minus TaxID=303371 RepID=A0A835YXS1_9STRA|nr:hypothetical protein JKP88DRAFT_277668 [Tribonema minus]